jgi:hypothetical protein
MVMPSLFLVQRSTTIIVLFPINAALPFQGGAASVSPEQSHAGASAGIGPLAPG